MSAPGAGVAGLSTQRRSWRRQGKSAALSDSLLGEELPDHARPTVARVAARLGDLARALAHSGRRALASLSGAATSSAQIAIFFSKMAMVTFGGAYAVLAYVAQQAVENYGWLKPGEMLDGLGMAETTPGPLIMVLQFVGFMAAFRDPGTLSPMLAGTLGGLLATWVTFTPCFLWIFLGAPFVEVLARQQGAERRALGDHRGGGRRGSQSRDLVRAAHDLSPSDSGARATGCRSTCRCLPASTSGRSRFRLRRSLQSSASRSA